jgi:large subunit ribosomal protein L38e
MPIEITDEKQFLDIAKNRASLCRIKKVNEIVKLKLRTPKHLYTFKTTPEKAELLLKDIEIERVEL